MIRELKSRVRIELKERQKHCARRCEHIGLLSTHDFHECYVSYARRG